jgi:3-oxoadipate enol-lactonase
MAIGPARPGAGRPGRDGWIPVTLNVTYSSHLRVGDPVPTLDIHGVTVSYEDTGPPPGRPDAPTIVFGHGLLFSGWMFHPQIAALRDRYRCVTVDWRGQGRTPAAATGGYDMDTLTGDAVALIAHLDVGPVHWVGLSMGGFVGQRLGARHGELLRSLTLLDTSADREPIRSAVEEFAMANVYPFVGIGPLKGSVLKLMFGPTFLADPANEPLVEEFVAGVARCGRWGLRKAILAVTTRSPIHAEIDRITVPTLVVTGADDRPTPPADARRIAERIPGAELHIVPECGHSATVEQPAAITGLIDEFLTRIDAG